MLLSIAVYTAFLNSQPIDEIFGGPALEASTIRFEAFNSLMRFFEARLLKPLQYVLRPSTH